MKTLFRALLCSLAFGAFALSQPSSASGESPKASFPEAVPGIPPVMFPFPTASPKSLQANISTLSSIEPTAAPSPTTTGISRSWNSIPNRDNPSAKIFRVRTVLTRQNLAPVRCIGANLVRPGKCIGSGLIIEDDLGEYLITARSVFLKKGACEVQMPGIEYRRAVARIDGQGNELAVCLLASYEKKLEVQSEPSGLMERLNAAIKEKKEAGLALSAGAFRINLSDLTLEASVATWPGFGPDTVECLEVQSTGRNLGTAFTQLEKSTTVGVLAGAWPEEQIEYIRKLYGNPDTSAFSLASGLSWEEVERIRGDMLRLYPEFKKKDGQAKKPANDK